MNPEFSALTIGFDPGSQMLFLKLVSGQIGSTLSLPTFEVDGELVDTYCLVQQEPVRVVAGGVHEIIWHFVTERKPGLNLAFVCRGFPGSFVLRFKWILSSNYSHRMTRREGKDSLVYFYLNAMQSSQPCLKSFDLTEIQLSHFDPVAHSYMPYQRYYRSHEIQDGIEFDGPIAIFHRAEICMMVAYEHGADHPNGFLGFQLETRGTERVLAVKARKGNYPDKRELKISPWESIWFEVSLFAGGLDDFLQIYRRFFLEEVCLNKESRKPYLFYNTWNYQERLKYFDNRPYLAEMNAQRMLAEIEVAHRLGVDVFVIDTGWYDKTGDWLVNRSRFPEGLQEIRRRLDQLGMKLGLWFNPTAAALTSRVFCEHPEWEMTRGGEPLWRKMIWETEESTGMCLASDYANDFIETMLRLNRELGVTYFKWDAVGQYGCDSPLHQHGNEANSPQERADCYAFELGRAMVYIVEQVSQRCPEIIVDFDITERGRFVGLGFLSVGKYFLINNGPYFHDFDIPHSVKIDPDTINVFFYPGPARSRICRKGVLYDRFIPSILFLTHYLPDGPRISQRNSLAALVLGGNGWWGDLVSLSEDEIRYLGEQVGYYKQVAEAATRAHPRLYGFPGSSPEIYEKIDPLRCCGLVAFFTVAPGTIVHFTQELDISQLDDVIGADQLEICQNGRLKLTVNLVENDARVVYILPRR